MPQQTSDGFVPDDGFQADQQQGKPEKSLKGFGENVLSSGGNFLENTATGALNLAGVAGNAIRNPVGAAREIAQSHPLDAIAAMGHYYKERYSHPLETAYQDPVGVLSDLSMLLGGVGAAGKLGALGKIPMAGRIGQVATAVSDATNPLNLVTRVPMAMVPKGITSAAGEKLYESSVKIPPSFDRGERMDAIAQGLHDRIPASKRGYAKNRALLDADTKVVNERLAEGAQQGKVVHPEDAAQYTDPVKAEFGKQVNPESDVNAIESSKQEFLRKHSYKAPYTEVRPATEFEGYVPTGEGTTLVPQDIPIDEAHAEKQATYRTLHKKYGELSGATTESEKSLARGLKERIYQQMPGLREIGEHQKIGIDLDEALERFVNREGNKQILGLEAPVAMAGMHAIAGAGPAATAGIVTQFFDRFPALKSRIAIALANRGMNNSGPIINTANQVKRLGPPAAQYGATQNPQQ